MSKQNQNSKSIVQTALFAMLCFVLIGSAAKADSLTTPTGVDAAITQSETAGEAVAIYSGNDYDQYILRYDTDCAFFIGFEYFKAYAEMLFEPAIVAVTVAKMHKVLSTYKGFNPSKNIDNVFSGGSGGLVNQVSSKSQLLLKIDDLPNLKSWVNTLDESTDAILITKIDELDVTDLKKLDVDFTHSTYGPEIKMLIKESPDDLANIWKKLKDDPAYSWEIKKTGGSRWEKWGQREFFKDITSKGKHFEQSICKEAFKNRGSAKYLELKQQFFDDFQKNLDDYDMFSQVQLKYNSSDDYFVADQVFVKYDAFGDIEDVLVIENKLSSSTPLTTPQSNALQSNSFTVRSNPLESLTQEGLLLNKNETLQFSESIQWYKTYSDGTGETISGIIKL